MQPYTGFTGRNATHMSGRAVTYAFRAPDTCLSADHSVYVGTLYHNGAMEASLRRTAFAALAKLLATAGAETWGWTHRRAVGCRSPPAGVTCRYLVDLIACPLAQGRFLTHVQAPPRHAAWLHGSKRLHTRQPS